MNLGFYSVIKEKFRSYSESKIILYYSLGIVLLFFTLVYVIYIAPVGIDKLFFVILFVIFWYSKADYFWFAFFLIINSSPAGLFAISTRETTRMLPLFSILPKASFSILDIFLIIALLKAIIKGDSKKIRDALKLRNIVFIFPYILIISFFYGVTLKLFLNATLRGLFFYSLIYSFPTLINNKRDVNRFMILFLPFVLIELASQLYVLTMGVPIAEILYPGSTSIAYNSVTGDIRAIPYGYHCVRLAYVFSFILLENEEKLIPKFYCYLIMIASLFIVIISATRSAIIMLTFIFIVYFFFIARRKPNVVMQLFVFIAILLLILDFSKVLDLNNIFGASYKRFVGMVSIKESGTIEAEDTFDYRISVRLPKLMESINKSLLVGYGLSDKFYENYDGHLGGVPIGLLQAGILGYFFYLLYIYNIFKKCFFYVRKIPSDNTSLNSIKVFIITFLGYSIVNFSVDAIFVLNTSVYVQDILIHLILASLFVYFALRENAIKRIEARNNIAAIT